MEIESGSVPLTSDDSSEEKDPSWDAFSPLRIALFVYLVVMLSIYAYIYWPNELMWLSK